MRIAKIETAEVNIPLVTPFKTALRTVNSVNDIVVKVTADDGRMGFGEAPPTAVITGDTKGSIRCAVEEFIAPNLIGMEMDLVEQPVNAHDFDGMKFVTANVATPVLADESVFSPEDAVRIIQNRAADLFNIKLMKTGGIYEALKICAIAESYGVECMIGCMLESKIAVSAAAHLAAGKGIITRADLDGPSLCSVDPYTGGPVYEGAMIRMNENDGIGITGVPGFEP